MSDIIIFGSSVPLYPILGGILSLIAFGFAIVVGYGLAYADPIMGKSVRVRRLCRWAAIVGSVFIAICLAAIAYLIILSFA